MSADTAQRFLRVYRKFNDEKYRNLRYLKPSIIYDLASDSTPDEVVDTVLAQAAAGETVTVADVRVLKDQSRWSSADTDRTPEVSFREPERREPVVLVPPEPEQVEIVAWGAVG
ncbi:MAG: hypothetical protein HQK94_19440 [Nitrospirae bacterium]|nr:hypothetical protein [Nitrospirota bacterium]